MKFIRYENKMFNAEHYTFKIIFDETSNLYKICAENYYIFFYFFSGTKDECEKIFNDLALELEAVQMDEESWQNIAGE